MWNGSGLALFYWQKIPSTICTRRVVCGSGLAPLFGTKIPPPYEFFMGRDIVDKTQFYRTSIFHRNAHLWVLAARHTI